MPTPEDILFGAELRDDLSTLDLHGSYTHNIAERVDLFLYGLFESREQAGKIVHGLGTGALEKAVNEILEKHPLILGQKTIGGATLVAVVRRTM